MLRVSPPIGGSLICHPTSLNKKGTYRTEILQAPYSLKPKANQPYRRCLFFYVNVGKVKEMVSSLSNNDLLNGRKLEEYLVVNSAAY